MAVFPPGLAAEAKRRLTPEPERELPRDPVAWTRDRLGLFLWSRQRDIMRSVVENRKTAVQSCHGVGKSAVAAMTAAWWIEAHAPGEALVVTTAPSGDQVRLILWGEIRNAKDRGGLAGTITKGRVPEWTIDGHVVAFGRKPQDFTSEEQARTQFQGIHARYLLVILDEACGIPKWLWDAVLSLVTNEGSRILAIGNPDDPTTEFATKCAPGTDYNVITVSAFDTPNFTGEDVPEQLRELLVGPQYVADAAKDWGEDSPLYIAKVLGQFPDVADDVIISPRLIREAWENDLSGKALRDKGRFGMDVADLGEDETVIYLNRAGMIRLEAAWRGTDTDKGHAKAKLALDAERHRRMTIDFPGIGGAVFHPLNNAGYDVTAYNGGEPPADPDRFVNRNAEAWWGFRESMAAGLIDLDPEDTVLAAQLQSRKWRLDASQRRIYIETKDEMKKRGQKSPDRADAAVLSWYDSGSHVEGAKDIINAGKGSPGENPSVAGDLLTAIT